ncbi:hypothetical protein [Streptomyces sp. NPDC086777]|uniref:hypothetical protein n=1 Tax=Streptomyces sp. NPDC086777 TaxID=3154866 RepID=UPI00344B31BB
MDAQHAERGGDETVAFFERRGLPESSYGNLHEESYDVHPGPLAVAGGLDLDLDAPAPASSSTTAARRWSSSAICGPPTAASKATPNRWCRAASPWTPSQAP